MDYIACYGDSLVQGFPFGTNYSWTAHAADCGNFKVLNYGVCGDCCDDILFRLRQYALPKYVRHVIFLGGANDVIQGRKLEAICADYQKLLDFCAEKNYKLCVVLPLVTSEEILNEKILELRVRAEKICGGKAFLLDLQPAIGMDAAARSAAYLDGVHPIAATYKAMGEFAAPILCAWLDEA